jgi:4-diphosphocytidyl-2-C-methyl-D-erythritol kinase
MLKNAITLCFMILFSPAKINLGLRVLERRSDGYHNIETVMYPTGFCDILEIKKSEGRGGMFSFSQSGVQLESGSVPNLCFKAWEIFQREVPLPPVAIHLHKQIPVGAGLGGGSSNATLTLLGLNQLLAEPLENPQLYRMASQLGSDCPFFLHQGPMIAEGRGEILGPVDLRIGGCRLVLLHPGIHISTAEAYRDIVPDRHGTGLRELLTGPFEKWKSKVFNDFEEPVFRKYPELEKMKQELYRAGALYASLSGSGSALYGIFRKNPDLTGDLARAVIWKGNF